LRDNRALSLEKRLRQIEDEDDDEHEDESSFSEFRFNPKAEDKR